jgi:hypothetical protein
MTYIDELLPDIDSAVSIGFVASTMRLINLVTPKLSLTHLEAASAVLGQSLAIVEHAIRALEAEAVKVETNEWTPVQAQETSSSSHAGCSPPPPSSPVLTDSIKDELEVLSIRDMFDNMTPERT